jgi:hypothetical protein
VNLSSLEHVRREMQRVYSDAKHGTLPTQDASRLIFCLRQIADLHVAVDVEKRIAPLEQSQQSAGN